MGTDLHESRHGANRPGSPSVVPGSRRTGTTTMRDTHDLEDGEGHMLHRSVSITSVAALVLLLGAPAQAGSLSRGPSATDDANSYRVHRLVSDQPGMAAHLDPNLVNAWGLVAGPPPPRGGAGKRTEKTPPPHRRGHP